MDHSVSLSVPDRSTSGIESLPRQKQHSSQRFDFWVAFYKYILKLSIPTSLIMNYVCLSKKESSKTTSSIESSQCVQHQESSTKSKTK